MIPHVAKATGIYLNSMLAVDEANRAGYDEAILLTDEGYVADGSGENIFVVKDGAIYTPTSRRRSCPGITRDTVIEIAQDLGYEVVEKNLIRTDLYLADEVFMTGTAAEVTPIRSVDDHEIGVGPVTQRAPAGVPRHGARAQRALVALARVRRARARARRDAPPRPDARSASRRPGSTSGRRSSCSRCCAPGGSRSGRDGRFEELLAERVGAPYAAAVSSGTAGLHLCCGSPGSGRATR